MARVVALMHEYVPAHCAGAETMAHSLLRHLASAGHTVDVVLSRQTGETFEHEGVRVHPHRTKRDIFDHLPNADLLVTHLENTPRATILGQLYDIPVVHLLHNTFEPTKNWLTRGPVALAVANSEWMAKDYTDDGYDGPLVVVRPTVEIEEYATTPGDRITLINCYERKGSDLFWTLAERMPDVPFLAVKGAYGDQDLRDLPNVEILDHTPHVRDEVYARTRILLIPSVYESWGRVGVEAMCSGIPVVANPTPGLKESLGSAGAFADRRDPDEWETHLRRLLKPRAWAAASKKAKARALELAPTHDLGVWRSAVEVVAKRR